VNDKFGQLAERIETELAELEKVAERIRNGWERFRQSGDDFYTDSVSLNIHGFYSGIERIFQLIARTVEGSVPQGANWHRTLLDQMSCEIPGVRPAVISPEILELLEAYRGFRHVVRNVYSYNFDPNKTEILVKNISVLFDNIRNQLINFVNFLTDTKMNKGENKQ